LHALKERIRAAGLPCLDPYPCQWEQNTGQLAGLETFGERVRDWLWSGLEDELGLKDEPGTGSPPDPPAEEADDQERFLESRLRVHVGRAEFQRTLAGYAAAAEGVACLVSGPAGCGKSAALARFVADRRARWGDVPVVPHFVGAGPRSTSLRG